MKEIKDLNFVNQHIYIGIDVHALRWVISIIAGDLLLGTFSQQPDVKKLLNHLYRNYPGGKYHCVYEAGFSGFGLYEELNKKGVDCIVINAADVPTTHKEKDRKTDKIDSAKLARCHSQGQLQGIYVHEPELYEERSMIRTRESLVQEQTRCKNRIKGLMKFFGIEITDDQIKTHWSKQYIAYLERLETKYSYAKISLDAYLKELKYYRELISEITKQIRKLSQTEREI